MSTTARDSTQALSALVQTVPLFANPAPSFSSPVFSVFVHIGPPFSGPANAAPHVNQEDRRCGKRTKAPQQTDRQALTHPAR